MADTALSHEEQEKDIDLQRKKFENYKLLSEVIKGFIEDFGKLIAILGIVLTMLSNLGLIAYNAVASNKDKRIEVPSVTTAPALPLTRNLETLIPESTIANMGNGISRIEHSRNEERYLLRKIKHEIFTGNNIVLLIFSAIFGIPLFFKKKKKSETTEVKSDASTDKNTN